MNNKDINELYKATMDNVTMPQDDKDDLRAKLAEQAQTGRSGHRLARVGKYAAIAAAVCAVLLCIPATRTTVSAAIDYIKQTFHLANGTEVTYEENSEGNSYSSPYLQMMSMGTQKLKMVVSTLFSEIPKKISPTSAVLTNISVMRSRMRTAHTASSS